MKKIKEVLKAHENEIMGLIKKALGNARMICLDYVNLCYYDYDDNTYITTNAFLIDNDGKIYYFANRCIGEDDCIEAFIEEFDINLFPINAIDKMIDVIEEKKYALLENNHILDYNNEKDENLYELLNSYEEEVRDFFEDKGIDFDFKFADEDDEED